MFNTINNGLNGVPDGMTLDADGNLWIAVWGAGAVAHVDARTGKLLQRIDLPAKQVCRFSVFIKKFSKEL